MMNSNAVFEPYAVIDANGKVNCTHYKEKIFRRPEPEEKVRET